MTKVSKKSVSGAARNYSSTTPPTIEPMPSTTGGSSSKKDIPDLRTSSDGNYSKGVEARNALMRGVSLVNDAVAATLGPQGSDAILEAFEWPYSIATNDGASIAERVKSHDPYEQMGVRLIQEAIGRANKASGDGSTTTCVLTAAILTEARKNPNTTKAALDAWLPRIIDSIDAQTKPVHAKDVWKVAAVSAQDEEMGKMIGTIYQEIGKDGVVDWEQSHTEETTFEIKEGVELKGVTYMHRALVNAGPKGPVQNPLEGDRIIVKNPYILITAEKINNANQLEAYVSALNRQGIKELVVFVDEIEPMALAEIEATALGIDPRTMQRREPFKVIVLKAPSLWKDWIYEDFALMTGATVFGTGQAATFKGAASLGWLGTCEKLVARRGATDIIGTKDISDHIATLTETAKERREFEKRIEWLNSKSALVRMGARSEVELTYKRLKFDDAKNAAKLALQGGVVAGGGLALYNASASIDNYDKVLAEALKAPYKQICFNAGVTSMDISDDIQDPALVVKNAITAAISVAGQVLNCDILIPQDKSQKNYVQ